jgi:hypothetical protein
MIKPQELRVQRVVASQTEYQVTDTSKKGPQPGSGILAAGRVVWIQATSGREPQQGFVRAYAEGIGVVSLDTACLHA